MSPDIPFFKLDERRPARIHPNLFLTGPSKGMDHIHPNLLAPYLQLVVAISLICVTNERNNTSPSNSTTFSQEHGAKYDFSSHISTNVPMGKLYNSMDLNTG